MITCKSVTVLKTLFLHPSPLLRCISPFNGKFCPQLGSACIMSSEFIYKSFKLLKLTLCRPIQNRFVQRYYSVNKWLGKRFLWGVRNVNFVGYAESFCHRNRPFFFHKKVFDIVDIFRVLPWTRKQTWQSDGKLRCRWTCIFYKSKVNDPSKIKNKCAM